MTNHTYKHNYTYLITNTTNGLKYIGVRSCNCLPENDSYMGSSKYLKEAIKEDSLSNFTKEILSDYPTRKLAVTEEIHLHNLHDVAVNPEYYNKSKQTSTGFDTTGIPVNRGVPKTPEAIQNRTTTMMMVDETGTTLSRKAHNKSVATRKKTDPETGLTGNQIMGEKVRQALSEINPETGLTKYQSGGMKKRGKNNYLFTGYYVTPWGKFTTSTLAQTDLINRKNVAKYCKNSDKIISVFCQAHMSQYFNKCDIGKTFHDLGFGFEPA